MSRYRWRMTQEGLVVIQEPPHYVGERVPVLGEAGTKLMRKIESDWGELCRDKGSDYGVPDGWLQAMIYRESEGKQDAYRKEGNGMTGIGLLQITHPSLKAGRKDWEVMVPETNVKIGAAYVAELIRRYGKDFPKVSAAFNAGGVYESMKNPWGMISTGDHVSVEVAALNTWIVIQREALNLTVARTFIDMTDLAREYDELARRDTEPPPDGAA